MMLNVVVCGTPGTGKSTLVDKLKDRLEEFNFIDLSKFAIENGCATEYDAQLDSSILDEAMLVEKIEPVLKNNRQTIIESIHGEILPERLVNLVFVCRASNTNLFDRLKTRGYSDDKIQNNIQAEIFQTIADEVREFFEPANVIELANDDQEDIRKNVDIMVSKINEVKVTHGAKNK